MDAPAVPPRLAALGGPLSPESQPTRLRAGQGDNSGSPLVTGGGPGHVYWGTAPRSGDGSGTIFSGALPCPASTLPDSLPAPRRLLVSVNAYLRLLTLMIPSVVNGSGGVSRRQ
jgi:hypothetical protein